MERELARVLSATRLLCPVEHPFLELGNGVVIPQFFKIIESC